MSELREGPAAVGQQTPPPAGVRPKHLEFPIRDPLGMVRQRLGSGPWELVGPARGAVAVHPEAEVRLDLAPEALAVGRGLGLLPQSGIHVLHGHRLPLAERDLRAIARCSDLESVHLPHCSVADGAMAWLRELPGLRALDLAGTYVSDAGLPHLVRCAELRALNLNHTALTDAGFARLPELRQLRSLRVRNTDLTDAIIQPLCALEALEELELPSCVGDDTFYALRRLPELNTLLLTGCSPGPAVLGSFYELKKLAVLALGETVDDHALGHLVGTQNLRVVWLEGKATTGDGLWALRQNKHLEMLVTSQLQFSMKEADAIEPFHELRRLAIPHADVPPDAVQRLSHYWWIRELRLRFPELTRDMLGIFDQFYHLDRLHLYESRLDPYGLHLLQQKLSRIPVTHTGLQVPARTPGNDFYAPILRGALFMRDVVDSGSKPWLKLLPQGGVIKVPKNYELSYRVTDGEADDLRAMAPAAGLHLTEIQLMNSRLQGSAARVLLLFPRLVTLEARNCLLDPALLEVLPRLAELGTLRLDNCGVPGPAGVEHLLHCLKLQSLSLRDSTLGDDGLLRLAQMPALKRLDVTRSPVSAVGVKSFRRLRPEVELLVGLIPPVVSAEFRSRYKRRPRGE